MADQTLRIFISSPSDVATERKLALQVLERLKGEFQHYFDLDTVLWEHEPLLATEHFQQGLLEPAECDIVVCIFWSTLGSPLPADQFRHIDGSDKITGTEWEFENAMASYEANGVPEILVYRKTASVHVDLSDDATLDRARGQRQQLEAFFKHWFHNEDDHSTFKNAYLGFETADAFDERLETHLRKLLKKQLEKRLGSDVQAQPRITWHQGSPFRGLQSFEYEHALIFFGRTKAKTQLLELLLRQIKNGSAFVMVMGMSGSGKSSLIKAGLLPMLTTPGIVPQVGHCRWCIFRPSDAAENLLFGLARALLHPKALPELAVLGQRVEALTELLTKAPDLVVDPLRVALEQAGEREGLRQEAHTRLVVVVDQLEEIFTLGTVEPETRTDFVHALAVLAHCGQVWVVGSMRSDFYHHCEQAPKLVELMEGNGQYHLLPPLPEEVEQMVRQPAQAAGLRFEKNAEGIGLDTRLREIATQESSSLPLLEFCLDELFNRREPNGLLSFAAYESLGGMTGALAQRAESLFQSLPVPVQNVLPEVLRALVTLDEAEAVTARRVDWERICVDSERTQLVEAFIGARLLVADLSSEDRAVVRVAHEALLRNWERIQDWLEENRHFLHVRARLAEAATYWESEGRLEALLLAEGKPVAEAGGIREERSDDLSELELAFVDASLAQQAQRLAEREKANQERIRKVTQLTRARRLLMAFSLLTILTVAGWIYAYRQSDQTALALQQAEQAKKVADLNAARATQQANRARKGYSWALAERSKGETQRGHARRSLVIALEAVVEENARGMDVVEVRDALFRAVRDYRLRALLRIPEGLPIDLATYSAVGNLLFLPGADGTAQLWDVKQGEQKATLLASNGAILQAIFTSTGHHIFVRYEDGVLRMYNAPVGEPLVEWQGQEASKVGLRYAAVGPKGARVALVQEDGSMGIWNTANSLYKSLPVPEGEPANFLSFSPDGRFLLAMVAQGERKSLLYLWNGAAWQQLKGHTKRIESAVFSPDSRLLATASIDETARIWDITTAQEQVLIRAHKGGVRYATFSPDGASLVTTSNDHTARVWDIKRGLAQGKLVEGEELVLLRGHEGGVGYAAFSQDGDRVVTASEDGTARLWRVSTAEQLAILGHDEKVYFVAFDQSSRHIISLSTDGMARTWVARDIPSALILKGHSNHVRMVAFDQEGQRALTASDDHSARIWDVNSGQTKVELIGHTDIVRMAAFNHHGDRVVTASHDGSIRIWDSWTGKELIHRILGNKKLRHVAFSPDDRYLVTVSASPQAVLWDARTGKRLHILEGHQGHLNYAVFSPDGQIVLTTSDDHTARLWDVLTGKTLHILQGHDDKILHAAFHPDGKQAVTTSVDTTLCLWRVAEGTLQKRLRVHKERVYHAAYSPKDGQRIISASRDKTACLWDSTNGSLLKCLVGHKDRVYHAIFSPNGKRVLTASRDGSAGIWEADTPGESRPLFLEGRYGGISYVAFSPTGQIATAHWEDVALIWTVPLSMVDLEKQAHQWVDQWDLELSQEERGQLYLLQ